MRVAPVELPVLRCPALAADREAGASKLLAEADVKRDVRVVGVHVQAAVLVGPVPHHEGVVAREAAARLHRVEQPRYRQHHRALELVDGWPQADVVDDDT